jgi:hypothetical protein
MNNDVHRLVDALKGCYYLMNNQQQKLNTLPETTALKGAPAIVMLLYLTIIMYVPGAIGVYENS